MSKKLKAGLFSSLKYDLPASVVVFLVALPLCLGIALASGAPLFSGVIAGIVGGILVAALSGSPLGVSGPAAGLAVIVLTAIQELGAYEIFLVAVVIGGIFQLILGLLKAGIVANYFPSAVIKGMLSAIGIIIILKQIPHAVGYDKDPEGDMVFSQADGYNTFTELGHMLNFISPAAIIISLLSIAILILWEQPFMKKLKVVPGPLIVVILGIVLNLAFATNPSFALSSDHIVSIPISASLSGFLELLTFPDFSHIANPQVWTIGITIAVVASIETLLSVEAIDKLDPYKRQTPVNRELFAQGAGNIVSGLVGGLPITQVIVRSSANTQSGGRTKMSAILHGILLFVCVIAIPNILNLIPLASLAAILILVGYKLAKPSIFKEMYKMGRIQYLPFIATIVAIVFTDLLTGIGIGMVVAVFQVLWNNYNTPYHFNASDYAEGKPVKIQLSEDVSFLNKVSILKTLNMLPKDTHVVIEASKSKTIHPDILEILDDFKKRAPEKNIRVDLHGFNKQYVQNPLDEFGSAFLDTPKTKKRNFFKQKAPIE